jgi:hypothetical protein
VRVPPLLSPISDPTALLHELEGVRLRNDRAFRAGVIDLLRHPNALVREAAFSLLLTSWRDVGIRGDALEALANDPDFGVRTTVAIGLPLISGPATLEVDTAVLRVRLEDESEDPDVRRAAYEGLCLLHGRLPPPVNQSFSMTTDVDWPWVRSLGSPA